MKEAAVTREALNFLNVFKCSRGTEGAPGFTGFMVEFNEEHNGLCVMQNLWHVLSYVHGSRQTG